MAVPALPPLLVRLLLPSLICVLYSVILGTSDRFFAADGPHMLSQALRLGAMVRGGELWGAVAEGFRLSAPHPPFGYIPLVAGAVLGLPLRAVVLLGDLVWLAVLFDGVRRLVSPAPWWSAQLGWLVGASASLTWWSADHHGFDLPAAAVVVAALGWLHQSAGLSDLRAAAGFGFWLAAGFLTKYSVPLVLFLPVMVVCLPALRRNPRGLGVAVVTWAVLAGPWLVANHDAVAAYVSSALSPPSAPGNFPEQRTMIERFAGEGQLHFVTVLKDTLGWPVLAVLAGGALLARRPVPLWGLVSGLIFLGAMNSREGRYAEPLVFLLAAAGAPVRAGGWQQAVMVLALVIPGLRATADAYRASAADLPSRRSLEHDPTRLWTLGPWPRPVTAFSPISEHPERWKVAEVLAAGAAARVADTPLGILLDTSPESPPSAVYQLVGEDRGLRLDLLTIHALVGPQGLASQSYRGPLTGSPPADTFSPLRREPSALDVVYVVTWPGGAGGRRWLAETPHAILQTWELPEGHQGALIRVAPRQALGGGLAPPP